MASFPAFLDVCLSPGLLLSCLPLSFLLSLPPFSSPGAALLMPPLGPGGSPQGGTDVEKHRDRLMVENEQLRQELRRCEAELQELRAQPVVPCQGCEHSQVGWKAASTLGLWAQLEMTLFPPGCLDHPQESAQLRDRLSQLQLEVAENKGMLSELNLEVQQKTDRLAEVELRLKDCLAEKAQEEERLSRRLRDSHETIASLKAQSPPIKVSGQRGCTALKDSRAQGRACP